ncbi:protein PAXX isoform X2 [Grus americana]|uniref:protein PAXX isoform X2 n=1 Tax=Grus americana TaxID=9117 RepID=UPI00240790FF|nr:protein PAXX isoform X2 [Grus americana]
MAEPSGPFHLLRAGPGRYLCYCLPGPGPGGTVYVTDALEVWAGELGARPPLGCRCQPEEHGTKLRWVLQPRGPSPSTQGPSSPQPRPRREALGRGAASLSLGPGKATLQLWEEARCAALDLFKLPITEARSQLQALVFGMAGRVESLERRLEVVETLASSCSPEKNTAQSQPLFLPGRQLPGGTSPGSAVCLLSLPQEAASPVLMCSPGHSKSPRLWLLSVALLSWCPSQHRRGQGSAWCLSGCLGRTVLRSDAGHHQTLAPGRTGVLARLCQPRGRSRESLSLTLASKARRHRLEWTLRTPDLCCPVPQ